MDKDLESALKRIRMVAQYGLEEHAFRQGVLEYIIEEVTEALNNAKEEAA